jgi:hypothetical protein
VFVATALDLLDRALALTATGDRPDLHRRLTLARQRLQSPAVRVLVVGEPKQGKSSLLNALVGAPVCPVGDDVTTRVPVVVRNGSDPRATLVVDRRPPGGTPGPLAAGAADPAQERVPVPIDALAARVQAAGPDGRDGDGRFVVRAEAELPRRLLAGGLELVDTAGVGGVGAMRSLATLDLLPSADAVLVVTDASQEFTAPEMAFVRQAAALCPNLLCVVTKTDCSPQWRRIVELDRAHLAAQGVEAPVFGVSSAVGLLAVTRQDPELYAESGLGPLTAHLTREILQRADILARRSAVHDLTRVTEQLTLALRSELAGLEDPSGQEALLADLERSRAAVDDLRRRSSRWQQMLADGVTDLMSDIDYDVRDRTRVISREAEAAIDQQDPGPLWPELTRWLDERIATAMADSYVWAEQRAQWLAAQVVDQFAADGGAAVPELTVGSAADALADLVGLPEIDHGDMSIRSRLIIGLRGSYSGVLMTGLITSLTGLAVINPFSVAAGVLLGRKTYNDDKKQRIQRRQNEAKTVVRRHLDEVVFQVSKQLKDRLRIVQRTLRDLITDTVDETSRSLTEAVKAAQRSAKAATAERDARIRAVRAQLDGVERLAREVRQLTEAPAAVP